jgi:hypothetical protein
MDTISKILEQELLKHVVEKSHMLSEAEKPMYKVGDNVTAWIQGGAPAKYKISGIAHIKVPIGDLKKGDAIYIAKKGNKTFYLTDADMRDPMNEKTLRPNGEVEDGDVLNDINEGPGWSKSALAAFRRKPMPGRYFISDETGAILIKGLKTQASVRAYFHQRARDNGYLGGKIPKVVNVHDGKKNNEVVSQYYWKGRGGIDIDNPTAGSYSKIDAKLVKYDEIEKQLGVNESVNEAKTKRINRNQAKLYEKGLKKVAKSVTFAKAAKQDGNIKLFVNYTKYTDRAKLKKAGEALGLTYLSDGRVTNRPSAAPIGGGVLGIQNNWMKFAKEA